MRNFLAAILVVLALGGCGKQPVIPKNSAFFEGRTISEVLGPPDDRSRYFCATEGMLGQMGDPPLLGAVKTLRLQQFEPSSVFEPLKLFETEIHFAEDGKRLAETSTFSNGLTTAFEKTDNGFTLHRDGEVYHYVTTRDTAGRPAQVDLFLGNAFVRTEERYAYDPDKRVATRINSWGQRAVVAYDVHGNPVSETWDSAKNPGDWRTVTAASFSSSGLPLFLRFEDIEGGETVTFHEMRWSYVENGQVSRIEKTTRQKGKAPVTDVQLFTYDGAGRLSEYQRQELRVRYLRNQDGHVTSIERELPHNGKIIRERIAFTNDRRGNWIRAEMASPRWNTVIERRLTYYESE